MASIKAFQAYRPPQDVADRVVTRTADTYSSQERKELLNEEPYSFLHVIHPEAGSKTKRTRPNSRERFLKVLERFEEFEKEGVFFQDERPGLYLYELTTPQRTFTGFIGTASVEELKNGGIRKHEQTLAEREELLKEYLKVCDINADPVLLAYPDDKTLEERIEELRSGTPEYDFHSSDDDRHHRLWPVFDPELIREIEERFEAIPALYIADGHHRSASSLRLALEMREKTGKSDGKEGFDRFMAFFIPESQLLIHGYHRCLKDLNRHSPRSFLEEVGKKFSVQKSDAPVESHTLHEFGMYLDRNWYRLYPDLSTVPHDDPVDSLDASILYDRLLLPVLEVEDPRTSKRVHFHGSPKGLELLMRSVDEGEYRVAFTLAPVPVEQLKEVADRGEVMPPKTTWIEPKLRSALLIYRMGLHDH